MVKERLRIWINTGLTVGMLAGGVGLCSLFYLRRPLPIHATQAEATIPVRVSRVDPVRFSSPVQGYGTVRPRRQVQVIPQVSGVVTQIHEDMAVGQRIRKGEVLFQIDPATYESQVAQLQANIRRVEANLGALKLEEKSLAERLQTAEEQLAVAETGLNRELELHGTGKSTEVDVELAKERYLARKEAMLNYRSQAEVVPFKIAEAQSQLDALSAQLDEAQRNVDRTRMVAPFEARVESVGAQVSQAVTAYFSIATLTDLEAFEVPVVVDPQDLVWADHGIRAKALGHEWGPVPAVTVTWSGLGSKVQWTGHVTRLERHDEATRMDRVVVEVPNPEIETGIGVQSLYRGIAQGMFVSVEFPAEPLEEALVLPRYAVQENGWVYVFEPGETGTDPSEGTLGIRRVPMIRSIGDNVVVSFNAGASNSEPSGDPFDSIREELASCELRPGEEIVLTTLSKPVVGMRIRRVDSGLAWNQRQTILDAGSTAQNQAVMLSLTPLAMSNTPSHWLSP